MAAASLATACTLIPASLLARRGLMLARRGWQAVASDLLEVLHEPAMHRAAASGEGWHAADMGAENIAGSFPQNETMGCCKLSVEMVLCKIMDKHHGNFQRALNLIPSNTRKSLVHPLVGVVRQEVGQPHTSIGPHTRVEPPAVMPVHHRPGCVWRERQ